MRKVDLQIKFLHGWLNFTVWESISIMLSQLLKYGLVGASNTLITFIVIAILTQFDVNPYASNSIGFAAGLINSFILNSRFTFERKSNSQNALKFALAFLVAYLLNLGVLYYAMTLPNIHNILAQLLAMITYNIAFFLFMKTWVFKSD